MRAWWWTLITAHLVWGNPERFKDDYGNAINLETNQNSAAEDKIYPSFILNPKAFYTRTRRSSEGDEREKKQMRFHSWGGKRYDEEEEEIGENSDAEENVLLHEPGDEELMTEVSFYPFSNTSSLKTDDLGDHFREAFTKRIKSPSSFSSWGGKRDPEMINDISKRSNFFRSMFPQNFLDSKLEQSRKRYPSFSSWAGKRAAAFNSWGGKRDYSTENTDYSNSDYSKDKIESTDGKGIQDDLNDEHNQVYTSSNSNLLDPQDSLNFINNDLDTKQDDEHSSRVVSEDIERHSPEKSNVLPESKNLILKRAASLNTWDGKRAAAFNSWGGKRAASFNSWGGKRAAAFNSWGGKRAAAFNSWGGKRGAAFNSWGGKRGAAFNSWGGKRGAAFNSWGGKRGAAFNSWGGKRDFDHWNEEPKFEYPTLTNNYKDLYGVHIPVINDRDNNVQTEFLNTIDTTYPNKDYILQHGPNNILDKTNSKVFKTNHYVLLNDKPLTNVHADESSNHDSPTNVELLGQRNSLEKRIRPSFTSWAGKRSPLFSSWYGNKIPTVLLTSGKRRPAFSSWGGKRSEHKAVSKLDCSTENRGDQDAALKKLQEELHSKELSAPEEKTYSRGKREVECSREQNTSTLAIERDKRASGNFLKNRVFTRMMLQGAWPMAFQSMSRGKDFFAWGGKRSLGATALR